MPFSIEAKSSISEASDVSATVGTKAEAIRKAIELQSEGYSKVRIIFDGKAYDPMELAAANIEEH